MFAKLKDWPRIAMRYDRYAHVFLSAIQIAAVVIFWINQCNINMVADQESKASALFWYTQRYHTLGDTVRGPRAAIPLE